MAEKGPPWPVFNLVRKLQISHCDYDISSRSSEKIDIIKLKKFSSTDNLVRVIIMNESSILSNTFSEHIHKSMPFFFFKLLV